MSIIDIKKIQEDKDGEGEIVKVTVSKAAEKAVSDLVVRVNDGFDGGRVNRQDLISWILVRFAEHCNDQDIRSIRTDHFDEITLLKLCLKKSKQSGGISPELRKLLLAQAGLDDIGKKATKNKLTNKAINDGVTGEVT